MAHFQSIREFYGFVVHHGSEPTNQKKVEGLWYSLILDICARGL